MTVLADGPAAAANPWRFSTKYHDTETSLVCYGYPYYSPKLARWVNRDPIGERGGSLGLARFVRNNPCGKLDLLGLFCGDCCPPAPGRPNRYNEQIMGIVRTPYGGAPWASDDLLDAVSNYTVLSDAIGFGQDLTEAALEGFTALITFLATREITDNDVADFIPDYGTFTSEAKEAIREAMSDLRDMIEANAYSIYLEVSYESCDPCAVGTILGPLTGYEMRSHTAYHKCVNASGLEVFGPSTGEIFTGADLQSCISGWESSRSLPSFSYWTPEY
jgi:RHS repeat-associated protein